MKWIGIIDLVIRCISILCTGLTIGELNDFNETHLASTDAFTITMKEIVDAAVARIAVTLVIQLLAVSVTGWWMYLAFFDKPADRVAVADKETEIKQVQPV